MTEKYLGESIPKLGFGLMRLPRREDETIDTDHTARMADMFLDRGFRYFDTAYGYPGSEEAIRKALFDRHSREEFVFATKLPAWTAPTKEAAEEMLNTSLARTNAGYIDFYLLHNLGEARTDYFERYGLWDYVKEKKAEGILKHVGFSFHDKASVLDEILTKHPEAEFVQLRINYADWESPVIESRKCYEVARRHGKPVVIMEPVKGGSLMNLPPEAMEEMRSFDPDATPASWAIRFAASLDGVITVLSGMSDISHMEDNTSYMKDFKPLTDDERKMLFRVADILNSRQTIPCTACAYCVDGCPMNINIPGIFEAVNLHEIYQDLKFASGKYRWNTRGHGMAAASECVECGHCEEVCPQHIHIRDELKKAAQIFDA